MAGITEKNPRGAGRKSLGAAKKNSINLSCNLTTDEHVQLKQIASNNGRSVASELTRLIRDFLANQDGAAAVDSVDSQESGGGSQDSLHNNNAE